MYFIRFIHRVPTKSEISTKGIAISNLSYIQYTTSYNYGETKVPGLPVYMSNSKEEAMAFAVSPNAVYRKDDDFVIIANIPEYLFLNNEAILGKNLPFIETNGQSLINLKYREFYINDTEKQNLSPGLSYSFDKDCTLVNTYGAEFYLYKIPTTDKYTCTYYQYSDGALKEWTLKDFPNESDLTKYSIK